MAEKRFSAPRMDADRLHGRRVLVEDHASAARHGHQRRRVLQGLHDPQHRRRQLLVACSGAPARVPLERPTDSKLVFKRLTGTIQPLAKNDVTIRKKQPKQISGARLSTMHTRGRVS